MKTWQLQEAKSRFSELIKMVDDGDTQKVTKNGRTAAYIVPAKEYEQKFSTSIKSVLLNRPHKDMELDIQRQTDPIREIEF
jgi:prevent-host-death family protein